jgi:uncharacterized membrane protein
MIRRVEMFVHGLRSKLAKVTQMLLRLRRKNDIEDFLSKKFLSKEISLYLLFFLAVTYTIVFSYFTLLKYYAFQTYAWDLGLFNQSFWTTLNAGRFLFYTLDLYFNLTGSFFSVHFSPMLLSLLPFYSVFQHPETLLVLQSLILASAAIPLYLLVKEYFHNRTVALVFALAYLAYPALQGVNWFDFHVQAFFCPFLFSAFYFFEKKRWKTYLLFILLTLMVEEQVAIILILYGLHIFWSFRKDLYAAVRNRLWKSHFILIPTITVILSTSYLVTVGLVKNVLFPINPDFLTEYKAVAYWSVLGIKSDPMQIPVFVLLNPTSAVNALSYDFPTKFLFLILLLAPLAFLSLRSSKILITIGWLCPALLSNNPSYYQLGYQYPAYIIPFIFAAAISGMKTISKDNLKTALEIIKVLLILTFIFLIALSPISPLPKYFNSQYVPPTVTEHDKTLQQAIALVPPNASILTQNNIFPHVSSSLQAYAIFPHPVTTSVKEEISAFNQNLTSNVQYILVDLTSDASTFDYALNVASNGNYGLCFSADKILLFKLNYTGKPIVYTPILEDYNFQNLILGDGDLIEDNTSESGTVLFHSTKAPLTNVFWSGPYTALPLGSYNVTFKLKVGSIKNTGNLLTLDVAVDGGRNVLAGRDLSVKDFEEALKWQNFTLTFKLDKSYTDVEFRGLNHYNTTEIYLDKIQLTQRYSSNDKRP